MPIMIIVSDYRKSYLKVKKVTKSLSLQDEGAEMYRKYGGQIYLILFTELTY